MEKAVGRIEAAGLQLTQELRLRVDVALEDGCVDADALVRVGVAAGRARLAEYLRDLEGEGVLLLAVAAVQHFDGVDEFEERQTGGFLGVEVDRLEALPFPFDR